MRRVKRNTDGDPGNRSNSDGQSFLPTETESKCGFNNPMRVMGIVVVVLMVVSVVFSVSVVLKDPPSDAALETLQQTNAIFEVKQEENGSYLLIYVLPVFLFCAIFSVQ